MVVAPKSTLGNWMRELNRFCPALRAVKFHGNQEERVGGRVDGWTGGRVDGWTGGWVDGWMVGRVDG